jgi:hypothetical protein
LEFQASGWATIAKSPLFRCADTSQLRLCSLITSATPSPCAYKIQPFFRIPEIPGMRLDEIERRDEVSAQAYVEAAQLPIRRVEIDDSFRLIDHGRHILRIQAKPNRSLHDSCFSYRAVARLRVRIERGEPCEILFTSALLMDRAS